MIAPLLAAALAAAAPPDPAVFPPAARPGDAVLVRVRWDPGAPPPSGAIAGRPLAFWRHGGEGWALAALPIETPPGPVAVEPGQEERRAAETLLGRIGSPDDVAAAVAYLVGAEFLTGSTLFVDGGRLLNP